LGDQVAALVLYFKNGLLLYFDGPNGPTFFQMWSLSIEEQFYLVFPLLFLGASAWLRRRAWIVFAALLVVCQLLMVTVSRRGTFDGYVTAYFSTPTRSAEVLAGVLLAYLVTSGWWRRLAPTPGFRLARQAIGVAGLVLLIHLFRIADVSWDLTHRWTMWTSVATVAVIVGCTTVGGASTALAWRPMRWIGKVSYGAYLYHLGVYFVLTSERTGIESHLGLSVLRYAATFVLAGLSFRFIESPLRHRATPTGWRLALAYGSVGALLIVLAYTLPLNETSSASKIVSRGPFAANNAAAGLDATGVAVVGDRGSQRSVAGLADLTRSAKGGYFIRQQALRGCPLTGSGTLVVDGRLRDTPLECTLWHGSGGVGRPAPNVAVLQLGAADLVDRRVGEGELAHLGEAKADLRLRWSLHRLADNAEDNDVRMVWVALPAEPDAVPAILLSETRPAGTTTEAEEQAARRIGSPTDAEVRERISRFNEILREVAEDEPAVTVVDPLTPTAEAWHTAVGEGGQGGS